MRTADDTVGGLIKGDSVHVGRNLRMVDVHGLLCTVPSVKEIQCVQGDHKDGKRFTLVGIGSACKRMASNFKGI